MVRQRGAGESLKKMGGAAYGVQRRQNRYTLNHGKPNWGNMSDAGAGRVACDAERRISFQRAQYWYCTVLLYTTVQYFPVGARPVTYSLRRSPVIGWNGGDVELGTAA